MKKFLSLVLSLVMTMSLVTIGAGATEYKDFTDKGEVQYEEAVAVLNKIGIITGYEDGSFKPTTALTRGAAAKIIVSLMIGSEAASALTVAAAPYKDVPVTNTFAAVISYCKTAGYINGYTDGTFRPTAALSGFAFSKMLLGALGYRGDVEGFTGTGWTMNVAKLGNQAGLFDDFVTSFQGNAGLDRESACLLALNTLKATEVEYTANGNNLNVNQDGKITGASTNYTRSYVTSRNDNINQNISREKSGNDSSFYTLEFGEEHFPDLKLVQTTVSDDYGRPSNQWNYKNVKIGTYAQSADYTYTAAASGDTASDKVKDMGLKDFKVSATSYTENGLTVNFTNTANTEAGQKARMEQVADQLTANGTLVQLYLDDDTADTITHVVVVKTQMMQVNAVKSSAVSLKKLDDNQQDKEGAKDASGNRIATTVSFKAIDDVKDDDSAYSTLKDLKTDDYVLVVPLTTDSGKSYSADKVTVPQSVTGKLTQIATKSSNYKVKAITVAGTAYTMSAQWTSEDNNLQVSTKLSTTTDTTVYLDTYGYAIYVKDVIDSNSSIIVDELYSTLVDGKVVTSAKGWDSKGNELSLNLGSSPAFKGGSALPSSTAIQGKVYEYETYTGNSADYRLIPNTTTFAAGSLVYAQTGSVINGQVSAKIDSTNTMKNFASDVKFIFESVDEDGDVTGITVHDGVTEVHKDSAITLYYVLNKAGDKIVAVVIPDDDDAANTANLLYVQKVTGYKQNASGDTVAVFTAYIDGKEVTGCEYTKKDLPAGGDAFYTYSENNGVYTLSKYTESQKYTKATAVVSGYTLNNSIITGDDYFTGKYNLKDSAINTLNAKNAQVVDLYTDDGVTYTSLKDMREAITAGKVGSFTVSYVYNGSDSTGAGTVSYIFITNNNAGSGSGSGSGSGTGVGSSFTTEYTVASNGKLNATVAYTAASWVKDAGAQNVTADVEVYANGAYYDTITTQTFAVGTDGKASTRLVIPTAQNNFPTDETLTFKVVDEAPSKVAVQYVDQNGKTLTVGSGYSDLSAAATTATTASGDIKFTVSGTKYAGTATNNFSVTGLTATVAGSKPVAGTETTTLTGVLAKGDAYVVVKIDTTGLTTNAVSYGITKSADLASAVADAIDASPTAAKLDKFGVTGATTDTLAITLGKDGSINANEPVKFTATVTGDTDNYGYNVTLKTTAGDIAFGLVKDSSAVDKYLTVTKDVEITGVVVTAVPAVKIVKAACSVVNAYTVEIGFNQAVKDTTIVAANFVGTTNGSTSNTVANIEVVNATTVRVTYTTAMADGATITVADVENATDKDNTVATSADVVTIGLTGTTYSIKSVG